MPDPEDAPCVDDSPKPKRVPWRKHTFDPDFLADLRRRYEQTSESINAIGRREKVSQQTIRRYAQEGDGRASSRRRPASRQPPSSRRKPPSLLRPSRRRRGRKRPSRAPPLTWPSSISRRPRA